MIAAAIAQISQGIRNVRRRSCPQFRQSSQLLILYLNVFYLNVFYLNVFYLNV